MSRLPVRAGRSLLRPCALLGAGALAVHEVAYRVSFGADAERALAAHGHGYLSWTLAVVSVLVALAGLRLAVEVAAARRGQPGAPRADRASLARRWAASSLALMVVHALQESAEGLIGAGHPGLLHSLTAHDGWVALLAAVAVGLVVACLAGGADAVVARAARGGRPLRTLRPAATVRWLVAGPSRARLEVLAMHLAGRGPPLARP